MVEEIYIQLRSESLHPISSHKPTTTIMRSFIRKRIQVLLWILLTMTLMSLLYKTFVPLESIQQSLQQHAKEEEQQKDYGKLN